MGHPGLRVALCLAYWVLMLRERLEKLYYFFLMGTRHPLLGVPEKVTRNWVSRFVAGKLDMWYTSYASGAMGLIEVGESLLLIRGITS
jgi:hypothetical protein